MNAAKIELTLGLNLDTSDRILRVPNSDGLVFNIGAFDTIELPAVRFAVDDAIKQARLEAGDREFGADVNPERFIASFSSAINHSRLSLSSIDRIRYALSHFTVRVNDFRITRNEPAPYPLFDLELQRNVVRYGNVELAVLESYLRDPKGLFSALERVIELIDDEVAMYTNPSRAHYLDSSDYVWNLRKMMTNAGFYVHRSANAAWDSLVDWAERYLSAMRNNNLAAYNGALPFSLATMRIIWERYGERVRHVQHPSAFSVYPALEGKNVIFMSPMAGLVAEQAASGRLARLFTHYQVPPFLLRTLPAWISTWPNRPHSNWSDTFARMCRSLDAAYREQPFDVFMASCGCYGLPICEYARSAFGCKTIYLGNITHSFFGIRQSSNGSFAKGKINEEAWINGNLGSFANMGRIDGGRYI